jgi:nitroimidazol reductase NimA-like FMN-containing flavoprotein (pyridoxamine 5'-phosphate oxidase superfamily)
LACSLENQPYVVPICFAYEAERLYAFSTVGQKIKWMRQNPRICLQADEIRDRSNWTSVVVNGSYLELNEPQYTAEKDLARERLAKFAEWWSVPLAERREHTSDLSIEAVFFRIDIETISGLRGIPEVG